MVNRRRKSKFLLVGSALMASASTFGSLGAQSVSADGCFVFSLDDLYKWLASLFEVMRNFSSSSEVSKNVDSVDLGSNSKINEPVVSFDDVAKNILDKEGAKWSFDKNNNRYTMNLYISLVGDFLVSVEPCKQENMICCVKVFGNGGRTLIKKFDVSSKKDVDDIKKYFQEPVDRVEKLMEITRGYNFFKFSKKSSEIVSLVLPSNLEFNLDSGAGKEYIVSGMEYDLESKLLKVYSADYDAERTPFLVCKDEKEIKKLLEKMSKQRKKFDYDLITKAKDNLKGIFGDEDWTYCEERNEYSVPFLVEGVTIPMSIKPTRFYGDKEEVICGYRVGYNDVSGYFFHTARLDNSVSKKLISMRDKLVDFAKLFKTLEKTGKFSSIQATTNGLEIKAKVNIGVRSKFEYTDPKELEGLTQIALENNEEPYLLKGISYQSNGPFAVVSFDKDTVIFDLEEDNDKNLFYRFVEKLLSDALNKNVKIGNQISQVEKLAF